MLIPAMATSSYTHNKLTAEEKGSIRMSIPGFISHSQQADCIREGGDSMLIPAMATSSYTLRERVNSNGDFPISKILKQCWTERIDLCLEAGSGSIALADSDENGKRLLSSRFPSTLIISRLIQHNSFYIYFTKYTLNSATNDT